MLTPEFLEEIPNGMSALMMKWENDTLIEIAKRLKANEGIFTSSMTYQLNRLNELNSFNTNYKKRLQELLRASGAEIDRIFKEAANSAHGYDKALFEAKGIPHVPIAENVGLQRIMSAAIEQTEREFRNLTQTTATKMMNPYGRAVTVPEFFEQTLDSTAMKVSSGVQSYDSAVKDTVKNMTDSGILNITYDATGKKIRRSIESVVRVTVLTGVSQMSDKMAWKNIETLSVTHVLVSKHDGARTGEGIGNHQAWQGQVFALNGYRP